MNAKLTVFGTILTLSLASGCATGVHRGVVAMKVTDSEAHVGIGSKEIKVGDHVELYHSSCESRKGCKKVSTGHGEVIQILNDDYSVVKFPADTKFSEGDQVEKHVH